MEFMVMALLITAGIFPVCVEQDACYSGFAGISRLLLCRLHP